MHLANWLVDVGANADYRGFQFTSGVTLARNGLAVTFKGEDAKIDLSGVFLARKTQHVDTTLVVDHAVPACLSRELFKGVLEDEARGIFQGKVIVRPDAQKTDGKQMAQVLMLSPNAEFDSKPELEIYADDVVCGHGSTSADLDEDLLFYCRSRGIPEAEARALLIESFVGEALAKIEREDVREALTEWRGGWLADAAKRTAMTGNTPVTEEIERAGRAGRERCLRRRAASAPTSPFSIGRSTASRSSISTMRPPPRSRAR